MEDVVGRVKRRLAETENLFEEAKARRMAEEQAANTARASSARALVAAEQERDALETMLQSLNDEHGRLKERIETIETTIETRFGEGNRRRRRVWWWKNRW